MGLTGYLCSLGVGRVGQPHRNSQNGECRHDSLPKEIKARMPEMGMANSSQ